MMYSMIYFIFLIYDLWFIMMISYDSIMIYDDESVVIVIVY